MAIGVIARCHKCNNLITITAKHASEVAKPICENCVVKTVKRKEIEAEVDNILDKILSEL
jgi:DNA-directed RNA polymerase subunit M/transcription elongation factor TFIIS